MKKYVLFPFFLFIISLAADAQKVIEETIIMPESKKVYLDLQFADMIRISSWDKNEFYFKGTISINNNEDNDVHIMEINKKDNIIEIETDFDSDLIRKRKLNDNCSFESDINYDIKVPKDVDLRVKSISGDIEIVSLEGPVNAKSISGFVDVSWGSKPADMSLKTITGEVFSDLELDIEGGYQSPPVVGSDIDASYNGGGIQVKLETISNNIYLRKTD